jgi:prepilin-type N-terminal cleavage/methylation domain-containing protein
MRCPELNEKAFTLLEILMVLLIVGFLAAASLYRFEELTGKHARMVVYAGVAELNCREKMAWAAEKLGDRGYQNDRALFSKLDMDLGKDYLWKHRAPAIDGGWLVFQKKMEFRLKRLPSSDESPGRWVADGL